MPVLLVVLLMLAVYRVTRFVTIDEFPPVVAVRRRVAGRWGDESWQAYLSECAWCASVYVAAGAVAITAATADDLPYPVLVWLAASAVTGFATSREGT